MKGVRRRYLAVEIDSSEVFDSKEFMDAVWGAVSKLYGEYGASKTGLTLVDFDLEKRIVVIRVVHTAVDMIRVALASIRNVNEKPVALHVITVSGTIKALYKKVNR